MSPQENDRGYMYIVHMASLNVWIRPSFQEVYPSSSTIGTELLIDEP